MDANRAYPRLRFVHVLASVAGAILFIAIGTFFLKVLPARQAQDRVERFSDMRAVGIAYFGFQLENDGRSPANADEMAGYLQESRERAWQRLSDGEYTIMWNAKQRQQLPISELLLGQEAVPRNGEFLVLFADARVASVTPDELRELPWVEADIGFEKN